MRITNIREVQLTGVEHLAKERFDQLLDKGKGIADAVAATREEFDRNVRDPRFWRWLGDEEVERFTYVGTAPSEELLLDVAYDDTDDPGGALLEALEELTRDLDHVTYRITGVVAGGGWPEVRFVGDGVELAELKRRYRGNAGENETPPVWSSAHVATFDRADAEDHNGGDEL